METRPYQTDCLNTIKNRFDSDVLSQLIVMATGTGKTVIFVNAAKWMGIEGRVLVLAHTDDLIDQALDKLMIWHGDDAVTLEKGDSVDDGKSKFCVSSVQTMDIRKGKFNPDEFALIIVDEAHRAVGDQYGRVLDYFGAGSLQPLLGFTATPERGDRKAMAIRFDEISFYYGILEAIKDGWLVPPRGKRMRLAVDLDKVAIRGKDFDNHELNIAINTPETNAKMVEFWQQEGENRRTVVFCVSIDHAKKLAAEFNRVGVSAEATWGKDKNGADKKARFKNNEFKVLLNCNLLVEGWDDPGVECVMFARPTKSKLFYIQALGRALRLAAELKTDLKTALAAGWLGKKDALVLDAGCVTRKHTVQSLPSVFGLPPKLDLEGKTITEAIDETAKIAEKFVREVDASQFESIKDMQAYAEHVELLTLEVPSEVAEYSELLWMSDGKGGYKLLLPNKEGKVHIRRIEGNPFCTYDAFGSVAGLDFHKNCLKSLSDAFRYADDRVRTFGRHIINLLRQKPSLDSKVAHDPLTPQKIPWLRSSCQRFGLPEPKWELMSQHDGHLLHLKISELINAEARKQPVEVNYE